MQRRHRKKDAANHLKTKEVRSIISADQRLPESGDFQLALFGNLNRHLQVDRVLRQQIPQGHRLPASRPRRTARVLRLFCRPLDALSNDRRHRISLRHGPLSELASQRLCHPTDHALDDLQDGTVHQEILAPLRGFRHLAKVIEGVQSNDGATLIARSSGAQSALGSGGIQDAR